MQVGDRVYVTVPIWKDGLEAKTVTVEGTVALINGGGVHVRLDEALNGQHFVYATWLEVELVD